MSRFANSRFSSVSVSRDRHFSSISWFTAKNVFHHNLRVPILWPVNNVVMMGLNTKQIALINVAILLLQVIFWTQHNIYRHNLNMGYRGQRGVFRFLCKTIFKNLCSIESSSASCTMSTAFRWTETELFGASTDNEDLRCLLKTTAAAAGSFFLQ